MWPDEDAETLKQNAFKICQEYLEGPWQEITINDFRFSVVRGGLSNRLFQCSLSEKFQLKDSRDEEVVNEVLLRIYGPIQDDISALVREASIFMLLSEKNMGPKLYGVFADGRLEQYIPSRSFKSRDLRKFSTIIGKEMAKIHCLHVPINKHPRILTELAESWLEFVEDNVEMNQLKDNVRDIVRNKELEKEMKWLKVQFGRTKCPVVFCHNDLQGGNILFREDKKDEDPSKSVLLIDFEFSCYNYRGFDIANHFCEWCFDYNTKEFPFYDFEISNFPSTSEQLEFIEAYLSEIRVQSPHADFSMEEEKKNILHEVMVFRLASHLLWCFWAFKMALSSSIDFAYSEYGKTRWDLYHLHKKELLDGKLNNGTPCIKIETSLEGTEEN